jgi:hypothetical protein
MLRIIVFITLIFNSLQLFSQQYILYGYLFDDENGEPLAGARIYEPLLDLGTVTGPSGFFSLALPAGYRIIYYSKEGYYMEKDTVYLGRDEPVKISLLPDEDLNEANNDSVSGGQGILPVTGGQNISLQQLRYMPPVFGEADLLKSMQMMPGIQSGLEGSNGMYVRGGTPDQNLILMDGVPIYNINHAFSFFSGFSNEALKDFQVYKGGFPARFGSRISSVVDISLKEGNPQHFSGSAGSSLVSFYGFLEGPVYKDKTTVFLSFKRSMPGLINILNPLASYTGGNESSGSYFYDLSGKITHRISDKDRIYLSFYNGGDKFFSLEEDQYISGVARVKETYDARLYWGNNAASLRWEREISPRKTAQYSLGFSRYQLNVSEEFKRIAQTDTSRDASSILFHYFSGIQDFSIKADHEQVLDSRHRLRYGAIYTLHASAPGAVNVSFNVPGFDLDTLLGPPKRFLSHELAAYIEDDIRWSSRLRTNIGLRLSSYFFPSGSYLLPEPRFSGRYLPGRGISLKGSYALMAQYLQVINNNMTGFPIDLWIPASAGIRPQQAHHYTLGLGKSIDTYWEISAEAFYKKMLHTIDYSENSSFIGSGNDWQQDIRQGKGRAYGAEFLLQKKLGQVSGFLGYTLAWNKRQFDDINGGREYDFRYDRRHSFSFSSVIQVSSRHIFSFNVVYGSGNPVTFPFGRYFDADGNEVFDYVEKNSYRMKNYYRVDLAYTNIRNRWDSDISQEFTISVYNLFNRFNPYYMYLSYNAAGRPVAKEANMLPFFPSFVYRIRF